MPDDGLGRHDLVIAGPAASGWHCCAVTRSPASSPPRRSPRRHKRSHNPSVPGSLCRQCFPVDPGRGPLEPELHETVRIRSLQALERRIRRIATGHGESDELGDVVLHGPAYGWGVKPATVRSHGSSARRIALSTSRACGSQSCESLDHQFSSVECRPDRLELTVPRAPLGIPSCTGLLATLPTWA
jgi:hypothetical protein